MNVSSGVTATAADVDFDFDFELYEEAENMDPEFGESVQSLSFKVICWGTSEQSW